MILKLFLLLTIILHFFAAGVAVRLTKVTKYNLSWMLISAGLILMAFRRLLDFLPLVSSFNRENFDWIYTWMGVVTSLCFATGVFLIQKIFKYMHKVEHQTRSYEKRLLNAVVQAEENERRRFATELHDGLGPLLSSIKMGLSVATSGKNNDEVSKNLELAVFEAISTVREISNNLSPHVLTHFGLQKAIPHFICRLNLPAEIKISTHIELEQKRYHNTHEIVCYRVICELIHNTIQHARATHIQLSLTETDNNLMVTYEDNGIGFYPELETADSLKGLGTYNMISRISSLKGEIRYEPNRQKGTLVTIKIPVE